jgi:hypothetical protein
MKGKTTISRPQCCDGSEYINIKIDDDVTIIPLGIDGVVIAILENQSGFMYEVRHFLEQSPRNEFFFGSELVKN